MSLIISVSRSRAFMWVTLAMLLGVGVTARLGYWQLSRAAEKEQRHAAIMQHMAAPELSTTALLAHPSGFERMHQHVVLSGEWQPQHTLYLENRVMQGRTGFWVLTPLRLDARTRVLVQRGWVPRHQQDRLLLPAIQTPSGVVHIRGRIAPAPSNLMTLGSEPEMASPTSGGAQIRQNLNLDAFASDTGGDFAAVVLQTDDASEGLQRDWPEITAGVEKNLAYAFQWFALAVLQLMLYIWFQFIQPFRHARRSSF